MSSLVSLTKSIVKESYNSQLAILWVLGQIDMAKFGERVLQSQICPDIETKCVLLEYNHTAWSDVKAGMLDMSDRMPGTDLLVHSALTGSPEFWRLANKYILGDDTRGHIYCRRKIDSATNKPIPHRMQLVVAFSKQLPQSYEESESDTCF
jgi:hypothetical protein